MRRLLTTTILALLSLVMFANPADQTATRRVTGKVLDSSGQPVIGATIMVPGTTIGSISEVDGSWTLNIPENAKTIEVSCIGYLGQTITIGTGSVYNVILEVDNELLSESVVIGYGTQKKVNLTGSVSAVTFEENNIKSRPLTNVANALSNAAPGLQIMQSAGRPGNEGFGIAIRGLGTLNSSGPLILVDGLESGIATVSPTDIESVSILKDAASCAIYGNRGANGVILITTKNGGSGGKATVSYDMQYSIGEPFRIRKTVSNTADYMELINESKESMGLPPTFSEETIADWRATENDPDGYYNKNGITQLYPNKYCYPNTEWWDWVYQKSIMQKHTVSVSGNDKDRKIGYNISFGYVDDPGIVVRSGLKQYLGRVNVFSDITNWLRVGARVSGSVTLRDRSALGTGTGSDVLESMDTQKVVPDMYPYYDGKFGGAEAEEEDPQARNVYLTLHETSGFRRNSNLNTNFYVTAKFLKHFSYDLNFYYIDNGEVIKTAPQGYGKYSFRRSSKNPDGSIQEVWTAQPTQANESSTAMYYYNGWFNKLNHVLNYSQSFGDHDVTALAGYEFWKSESRSTSANKLGLLDKTISDLDNGTSPVTTSGRGDMVTAKSFFARLTYAYKSKYLFEADFRADGSSRFAPENRWGYFPSFSAAWRISEEPWMKGIVWLDNLKARASWGMLGNNAIGNYEWQSIYTSAAYAENDALRMGIVMSSVANREITWESTKVTNFGLDFGMLGDRLTGSVDVYDKFTDGILYTPDISSLNGEAGAPRRNIAQVDNKGIELELGWKDTIGDFFYSIKGNFAYNRNRVVKYKGKLEQGMDANGNWVSNLGEVSTGSSTRILEDHEIGEWYIPTVYHGNGSHQGPDGGPTDGMIRTEADYQWVQDMKSQGYSFQPLNFVGKSGIYYGDLIYADNNGDKIFGSSYDSQFLGCSTNPKYNFGLQASAMYKGLDFSMNWGGAAGFMTYYYRIGLNSTSTITPYSIGREVGYDHYFFNPDNPSDPRTNTTSKNPRLQNAGSSTTQNTATSTFYLYKGDFLKLRNLTLGYTFPQSLTRKIYVEKLRVFASGENLYSFDSFPGQDPEQRTTVGYSTIRRYTLGVNVTF